MGEMQAGDQDPAGHQLGQHSLDLRQRLSGKVGGQLADQLTNGDGRLRGLDHGLNRPGVPDRHIGRPHLTGYAGAMLARTHQPISPHEAQIVRHDG
jgi:hypothetical protein